MGGREVTLQQGCTGMAIIGQHTCCVHLCCFTDVFQLYVLSKVYVRVEQCTLIFVFPSLCLSLLLCVGLCILLNLCQDCIWESCRPILHFCNLNGTSKEEDKIPSPASSKMDYLLQGFSSKPLCFYIQCMVSDIPFLVFNFYDNCAKLFIF